MRKNIFKLILTLCVAFIAAAALAGPEKRDYQIFGYMFDLDDNLVRMPTVIVLINKDTGEELAISTEKFAEINRKIGQPGEWVAFKIDPVDPLKGSFRFFRDEADKEQFINDLKMAVSDPGAERASLANFRFATSNR